MTQAFCKTTINISADTFWQAISEFGAGGRYLAGVVTCTVEGAGVGVLRTAVRNLGPNQAELEWSATFEPDGIPASEAEQILESAMSANCLALKQFMER